MPVDVIDRPEDLIERIINLAPEDVEAKLPSLLGEIEDNGVEESMNEYPGVLLQIFLKLEESDLVSIGENAPEIFDRLIKIVWSGVSKRSEAVASYLEAIVSDLPAKKLVVNFETFDTPLKLHFVVSDGKFSGGVGMTSFREQDCRWFADTKIILALMRGEFRQTMIFTEKLFFEGSFGLLGRKAVPLCALLGSLLM